MNKTKRLLAGLLALTISAASMGAASADAYGILDVPTSQFEYELTARTVSDTQIELKIDVTNNPGFNQLAFALHYDNCTYDRTVPLISLQSNFVQTPANNPSLQNVFLAYWRSDGTIQDTTDYFGDFSVCLYFNIADSNVDACEFSVAVVSYYSNSENISFDKSTSGVSTYSYELPVETSYDEVEYRVGDMDNDGYIELSDVSDINRVIYLSDNYSYVVNEAAEDKQKMGVEELNRCLSYGAFLSHDWRSEFEELVCAEVADVNKDYVIDISDSSELAEYYANSGAGVEFDEDEYINSIQYKTTIVLV